jgi:hypothetical protein
MSAQALPTNFPAPKTPLVDKTGAATQDGRFLLLSLFNRTGAGDGIIPQVSGQSSSANPQLLVAAGATQATALLLNDDWNYFGTVGAGLACLLQVTKPGTDSQVFNGGANNLNVFPPAGFQIDALGVNNPYVLAPGKLRIFACWSTTLLVSIGN